MAVPTFVGYDASGSQSTATITHTIPAGWSAGDFVVAHCNTFFRSPTGTPSGWTLAGSATGGAVDLYAYYKTLAPGDPGSTFSLTLNAAPSGASITLLRVTGHDSASPMAATPATATDGGDVTTHVSPAVTTTVGDALILRLVNGDQAGTASSGDTGTAIYADDINKSAWWSSLASAGSTGTATYTTGVARFWNYVTLAVAPASGGGPVVRPHWQFLPRYRPAISGRR